MQITNKMIGLSLVLCGLAMIACVVRISQRVQVRALIESNNVALEKPITAADSPWADYVKRGDYTKREWTQQEKVRMGYMLPFVFIRLDEIVGTNNNPNFEALLINGIAIGIALERGPATNDLPYAMLEDGVRLWDESKRAYFEWATSQKR